MRISINWLKELVDYDMSTMDLANRLNGAGMEVAQIDVYGSPASADGVELPDDHMTWDGIFVGEIVEVKEHPDADRLRIAIVDCGEGPKQSVTGAPNIEVGTSGQKVAVATLGANIFNAYSEEGGLVEVKSAKLRGETSEIVLCSEKELKISDQHGGIILLDEDAPVGTSLSDYMGDIVIEIELTPDMSRCLNMVGIAREVAALAGGKTKFDEPDWADEGDSIEGEVEIEIEDPEMCNRFTAALIKGVTIKPSPFWMQYRLTLVGQRPISNIVDITNYVMLEWGQPMHAYDHNTLTPKDGESTPYILVRNAKDGERLTTLDGTDRALDPEMVLITDGSGPIGLAGIMGGLTTEVSDKTQDVLLEAAHWHNINNRRTAQKLKLFSEASARFSKGLPPKLAELGLKRGADLMRQYGGGTISKGFVDVYPKKPEPVTVKLPVNESTRLLGVELSAEDVVSLLKPLEFECDIQGDMINVVVPYYRLDVRVPADLVEEVARMYNYDKIPNRLLEDALPPPYVSPSHRGKLRVKRLLNQMGLQEVINYTLTNPKTIENFDPKGGEVDPNNYVQLENTLSSERSIMRQTMLPTMLETAEVNWRFQDRVTMFEIGRVFLPVDDEVLPNEPTHLGIVMLGQRDSVAWLHDEGSLDFFDLKGVIEGLLDGLYITSFEVKPAEHSSMNPGRCAELFINKKSIGVFGELHPRVGEAFDLEGRIGVAELNLDTLLNHVSDIPTYISPPRFPSIVQDVALVVDQSVPNVEIETLIRDLGQPLLDDVKLFDVYTGEHVDEGKRSLAYSITYQAEDRTLTDEEVTQVHEKIQQGLKDQLNAEIRGLDT